MPFARTSASSLFIVSSGPQPLRMVINPSAAITCTPQSNRCVTRELVKMSNLKMTAQYLEDFAIGQMYRSSRLRVDKDQIIAFAAQFDPQSYHLDEEAGRKSVFGGLVASGWHTAALTMRLLVDGEFRPAGGILGVGFDELSWPRPVRAGDELHTESEVLEVRPSKSRPDRGLIKVRTTTLNQNGEAVQIYTGNLLVPRRPADAGL
jgi:acyl dehydratase